MQFPGTISKMNAADRRLFYLTYQFPPMTFVTDNNNIIETDAALAGY